MSNQDMTINPTNEERHRLLLESLDRVGRAEDFENIVELLSPPPDILKISSIGAMKSVKIGVIGAGLAGLSAAYELRKLGAEITVFDADKDRIGGRVLTYYFDRSKQYYGEFGAARIPVSHETTWHYLNLFHLNTETIIPPQPNNFIYAHGIRVRRDPTGKDITEQIYPHYDLTETEQKTPWNILYSYATTSLLNHLTPELRMEILKILPNYSEQYAAITRLSSRQVFEMLGLSQGAIELLTAVDPFTGALINISYDELMNTYYSLDFLNTYRIKGGMALLPYAFYDSMTSDDPEEFEPPSYFLGKVHFRPGQVVTGISQAQPEGRVSLRCRNAKGTESSETFDYVVCAIPFSTLRDVAIDPLFSNQKMQAIKEWNYIDAQRTAALCKKRFWEEDEDYGRMNGGASFTDLPIQSILYPPDHISCRNQKNECSPDTPGVLVMSYNLGQDSLRVSNQPEQFRYELIERSVEEVHGLPEHYLDSVVQSYQTVHWNSEYWNRGAFSAGLPGQKVNFLDSIRQPEYNHRIFFAGEHASTKPGWMQGALYSGKLAANQIAQQFPSTSSISGTSST